MPEHGDKKSQENSVVKPRRKRVGFWLLGTAFLLALFGIWFVFSAGPVTVPLLGTLLASQGSRGPVTLEIDSASVDFTDPNGIKIVVYDARVDIAGGSTVQIKLPKLEAPLNREALYSGNLHFSSLELTDPEVIVGLSGGPAAIPEIGPLMEAIDRMSDLVDDQFARRALNKVSVRNASFQVEGPAPRSFNHIDVDIYRNLNRTIRAFAKVSGGVSTWRLELGRSAPEGGDRKEIGLVVNGITLAELLGPNATEVTGKGLRLPASAKIEALLTGEGNFISANAVARVSNGWFQLGRTLVAFDDAALSLVFRGENETIELTKSHVIRGNTRIFFSGSIEPPEPGQDVWTIEVDSKFPEFGSSDIAEPPQMLDGVAIRARFDSRSKLLLVDRFTARAGKAVAHGVANVQITPKGPYLGVAVNAEKIPAALAKQVWPITLVPPARKWFIDHINGGLIESASYTGALRPPAFNHRDPDAGWSGDDMTAELTFTAGQVSPIGDVPEVKGMSGTLTIENETMTVTALGGTSIATGGGEIEVPETTFQIFNLPLRHGKTARIQTRMIGQNTDLGSVMNSAPFEVLDRAGLKQGGVSGSGEISIDASFAMEKTIPLETVNWRAKGRSADFSDTNPIMGHTIRDADIVFEADKAQVAITGNGVLDGLKADINLVVPLGDSQVAARQDVVVSVTSEQLKERGIDLTAFLDGPMVLSVVRAGNGQDFVIDLKQTEVRLNALGWKKATGVPATAKFRLIETESERKIQDFELVSEGVDLFGQIELTADGELITADFDRFQLRPGDDVEVDIRRAANGRYDIIFAGASFDGRGLIRSLSSPGGSQGEGDFAEGARISADIGKVTGFNNRSLTSFSGKIETGPKGLRSAVLNGLIDNRSDFKFTLTEQDGAQLANGQFADTGATLAFLNLYERMSGGSGILNVVLADEDSWVGDFSVRTLAITEDPAIKRIRERDRNNLNRDEPFNNVQAASGSANFDTLDINFTRDGSIMTISRGALKGNALGGTVSGTVDLENQQLNMTGTFVPIYALNNFFAKIPLLGFALGGGSGEGLIGVTYRLSGPIADPALTVNPISAIAPGIFRKMFEFQAN